MPAILPPTSSGTWTRSPAGRWSTGPVEGGAMQHHPVAAAMAAAVARRDPQRLSAALTETVRLRALLPGGPVESHGRKDVAARFCGWFADFDTVKVIESGAEAVVD